jgi:hypothetical protein
VLRLELWLRLDLGLELVTGFRVRIITGPRGSSHRVTQSMVFFRCVKVAVRVTARARVRVRVGSRVRMRIRVRISVDVRVITGLWGTTYGVTHSMVFI